MHRLRGLLSGRQIVILLVLAAIAAFLANNIAGNLAQRGKILSFDFLARPASFDVPFQLIEFSSRDSYARAALTAFLNTLLVAAMSIGLATLLGFLLGASMLSPNPLLKRTAFAFVELIKNTPQVLQILFWYVLILYNLPTAKESFNPLPGVFINVRGLFLPSFQVTTPGGGQWIGSVALAVLMVAAAAIAVGKLAPAHARLKASGALLAAALLLGAGGWLYSGASFSAQSVPELKGFNFVGGIKILPELIALWIGLSVYAASFIADLVRGAVLAVPAGQEEAARSLGLNHRQTLWLVRLPQAMQIVVPPLVSQYLNITKSSTLGIAVAYPEIMTVVGGTTLNQTGHALECMAIIMGLFLAINLLVSLVMNFYNSRIAARGLT